MLWLRNEARVGGGATQSMAAAHGGFKGKPALITLISARHPSSVLM
jgi:hypothetical protein